MLTQKQLFKIKLLTFLLLSTYSLSIFSKDLNNNKDNKAGANNANKALFSDADINLNFRNTSLLNFLKKIELIFKVNFIFDSDLSPKNNNPESQYGQGIPPSRDLGNSPSENTLEKSKITYSTNEPLTKQELWSLTDSFLRIAGFARVKITGVKQSIYRIVPIDTANKEALPVYINTDLNKFENNQVIRYVYYLKRSSVDKIIQVLNKLKSKSSMINSFDNLKALIFTDNVYNIKSLLKIVKELDNSRELELLSFVRLNKIGADEMAGLINKLADSSNETNKYNYGPFIKNQELGSILKSCKIIPEPRSKMLIVLGPRSAINIIEKLVKEFDKDLDKTRNHFWVEKLNFKTPKEMASILTKITKFGRSSQNQQPGPGGPVSGGLGGILGNNKFFGDISFEAEESGNNLIIRGEPEDYKLIKSIIKKLDKKEAQVAIEVLIVNLISDDDKGLSSQINSKKNRKVNAQTSGFDLSGVGSKIQTDTTTGSLVTNLLNIASRASIGSTILSLGRESAWALLGIISKTVRTNIVSNPFLVTTNKYPARVIHGETRRVVSGTVQGSGNPLTENESISANLEVNITPQINTDGVINMDIDISIEEFTDTADSASGNKSTKNIRTNTNVANGEVLALGGLVKRKTTTTESGLPFFSKIPILGNLVSNKKRTVTKESLLIFITPRIILSDKSKACSYSLNKSQSLQDDIKIINKRIKSRDPLVKWFFKGKTSQATNTVKTFVDAKADAYIDSCMPDVIPGLNKSNNKSKSSLMNSVAHSSGEVI